MRKCSSGLLQWKKNEETISRKRKSFRESVGNLLKSMGGREYKGDFRENVGDFRENVGDFQKNMGVFREKVRVFRENMGDIRERRGESVCGREGEA